jgi:hypothetical protein
MSIEDAYCSTKVSYTMSIENSTKLFTKLYPFYNFWKEMNFDLKD